MNTKNRLASTSAFIVLLLITIQTPLKAIIVPSTTNTGKEIPREEADRALKYWTKERIEKAKPLPLLKLSKFSEKTLKLAPSSVQPLKLPIGRPSLTNFWLKKFSPILKISQLGLDLTGQFPFAFGSVSPNRYQSFPEKTVGVLFFTIYQTGQTGNCSASAVNSTRGRLIITAGHCVSDGANHYNRDFLFIPAYKPKTNEPEPYGRWTSCGIYVKTAWHERQDRGQDIAGIKTCTKGERSTTLHSVIGALSFAANIQRKQSWYILGYPSRPPFDGKEMQVCSSDYGADDLQFTPNLIKVGCNMTMGASGGPWIRDYSATGGTLANQINGISIADRSSEPKTIYSPYFGDDFLDLLNFANQDGS